MELEVYTKQGSSAGRTVDVPDAVFAAEFAIRYPEFAIPPVSSPTVAALMRQPDPTGGIPGRKPGERPDQIARSVTAVRLPLISVVLLAPSMAPTAARRPSVRCRRV